jgi:hypothetical protein
MYIYIRRPQCLVGTKRERHHTVHTDTINTLMYYIQVAMIYGRLLRSLLHCTFLTECNQQKQGRSVAVVVLFVLMLWRSLQYLAGPARISKVGIIEPYVNQISYKDQNTMKQYIYKRKKGRSNQPGTKEVSENKGLTLVDRL